MAMACKYKGGNEVVMRVLAIFALNMTNGREKLEFPTLPVPKNPGKYMLNLVYFLGGEGNCSKSHVSQ